MEGTIKHDSGAEIRDGIKSVATLGVCLESAWPYNIAKFASKPSAACFKSALTDVAIKYLSIDNTVIGNLKSCLAGGSPFVYGFTVYESFESEAVAGNGVVPMPGKKEKVLGGHAVVCVGYDDTQGVFICRNSWGTSWGQSGYFMMPYAYLINKNLASDFWVIQTVK